MFKQVACALVLAPLLGHAAPQAAWLSCSARPDNLVALDSSFGDWPSGDIVVVEGFIGSVTVDDERASISVNVRAPREPTPCYSMPMHTYASTKCLSPFLACFRGSSPLRAAQCSVSWVHWTISRTHELQLRTRSNHVYNRRIRWQLAGLCLQCALCCMFLSAVEILTQLLHDAWRPVHQHPESNLHVASGPLAFAALHVPRTLGRFCFMCVRA